jgi:hypothetical protein
VRALENQTETERRAATWYHATQLRLRLSFTSAYTGDLHLYALDWDTTGRRENVTVSDGTTTKTVNITTSFNAGAWMHFPISVQSGDRFITVDRVAGTNAVLSGSSWADRVRCRRRRHMPTPTPTPTPTPPTPTPTPTPTPHTHAHPTPCRRSRRSPVTPGAR